MTNFGNLPERDRQEAGRFWIEALAAYRVEEVREAFVTFTRRGGYPNPQAIVQIIEEKRKEIGRQIAEAKRDLEQRAQWEAEQERKRSIPDMEQKRKAAEAIMAGFRGE